MGCGADGSPGGGVPVDPGAPDRADGSDTSNGSTGRSMNPPAEAARAPDVGIKGIHRLSNTEYNNTVRDLLGTTLTPADGFVIDQGGTFDNLAEALSMSALQVRGYFEAATALAEEAFSDPARSARVLTCQPDAADLSCATRIITDFGLRAYRRPLEQAEIAQLLAAYRDALALGADATRSMRHVTEIMLTSPQFLYRIEFDPDPTDPTPHALTGYELASRLSYMLWASMPDDALLSLAGSGELDEPAQVVAQVERLLADERSSTLVTSLAAQWLGINRVEGHQVNSAVFPRWDAELASAMRREMELYFSEFLYGDRSYAEFLTADVNFVNARLAEHYGMAPPSATAEFSRVEEFGDARQGLLGLGGFLTHTSRTARTSPIVRGNWVLDAIWCQGLQLPTNLMVNELEDAPAPTTLREQIAEHRANPACAGCHNLIDPIGLGLEKFDGIGAYREQYADSGLPIDTLGQLPGGIAFDGLLELNQVLTASERFLACAAEKLFTYGLGRTVGPSAAYVDQIASSWIAEEPSLRNLIKKLVVNDTFRFRRAEAL